MGSPDMVLEFPGMVPVGTCRSPGTLSTPSTVGSWWRSLNALGTQNAAGAPVRSSMICVSANLRRGGCHNRFTLAPWSGEIRSPLVSSLWDRCHQKMQFVGCNFYEIFSWWRWWYCNCNCNCCYFVHSVYDCQIRTMFMIERQKEMNTFDLVLSNFVFWPDFFFFFWRVTDIQKLHCDETNVHQFFL